jgi:hypothetical protein
LSFSFGHALRQEAFLARAFPIGGARANLIISSHCFFESYKDILVQTT